MINASRGMHRRRFRNTDIKNLELLFDITDYNTLTFNGSNVSAIADKSGNNRDATQSIAVSQPLYSADGFNGKPCINFDGYYTFLYFVAFAQAVGQNCWAVIDTTELQQGWRSFLNRDGTAASFYIGTSGYNFTPSIYNGGAIWGSALQKKTIYRWGLLSSTQTVVQTDGHSAVTGRGVAMTNNWNQIGYHVNGIQSPKIKLSEVIMTNSTPTAEEILKIEGMLAHKYWNDGGVSNPLPANHKYKNMPPML